MLVTGRNRKAADGGKPACGERRISEKSKIREKVKSERTQDLGKRKIREKEEFERK